MDMSQTGDSLHLDQVTAPQVHQKQDVAGIRGTDVVAR